MKPMIGMQFHKLRVIELDHRKRLPWGTRLFWKCLCECGHECVVEGKKLRTGHTHSCGCYRRQRSKELNTTHGCAGKDGTHRLYKIWAGLFQRCRNPNNNAWIYYGAKGISVCERWNNFALFLGDMGSTYQEGLSIDRIDSKGNYTPENCRWATASEQNYNSARTRWITFEGVSLPLGKWAAFFGLNRSIIPDRLKRGWSVHRALTQPVQSHFNSATP